MTVEESIRPFVLGVLLTDEWAASPNMGETTGDGASKAARMKTIRTSEGIKTMLSGQAVGSWHRRTLYDRFGWSVSELQETLSGRDTRSFYTQCQPVDFAEDDGRGYLAAVTLTEDVVVIDKSGKEKIEKKSYPATTKRTSPFMLSQFQSVAPNRKENDFGILARDLDELPEEAKGAMIFRAEVAAAAYAGLFALNISELGQFAVGLGRDLLPFSDIEKIVTPDKIALYKKPQAERSEEEKQKLKTLIMALKRCIDVERGTVLCLPALERKARANDLIAALADLEGGAHMTRRLYNVAPSTALIMFANGGNCLPPHIFRAVVRDEDGSGSKNYKFEVDITRLHKILWDNQDRLLGAKTARKNPVTGADEEVPVSVFFGTLGAPSIENEEDVKRLLSGQDKARPLPLNVNCQVYNGPREAIRAAASAMPIEWFSTPSGATELTDEIIYGERLLERHK